MVNAIERNLRKHISRKRMLEMDKYGRIEIYNKINKFLHGNRRIVFSLVNHSLPIVDDSIDESMNIRQLDRAKQILDSSFHNKKILVNLRWEKYILELGQKLSKLKQYNFIYASDIFYEIMHYWD